MKELDISAAKNQFLPFDSDYLKAILDNLFSIGGKELLPEIVVLNQDQEKVIANRYAVDKVDYFRGIKIAVQGDIHDQATQ